MKTFLKQYIRLIEDHARVAYYKIKKPSQCTIQDLVQEGVVIFLLAKQDYNERKASFKTFFTMRLRNHFSDIVKKSYQNKEIGTFHIVIQQHIAGYGGLKDENILNRILSQKNTPNPIEVTQITFLLKALTPEELEYTKTMIFLHEKAYHTKRRITRETLGISYAREVKLRNSIRSKMKK